MNFLTEAKGLFTKPFSKNVRAHCMSIKIKDLARQLNLSVATISKALKDSHEISPETKK